jgi:hypothetical protein
VGPVSGRFGLDLLAPFKGFATWIDSAISQVATSTIPESVLSNEGSPHVNIFYCMGGLLRVSVDFFSPGAVAHAFYCVWQVAKLPPVGQSDRNLEPNSAYIGAMPLTSI